MSVRVLAGALGAALALTACPSSDPPPDEPSDSPSPSDSESGDPDGSGSGGADGPVIGQPPPPPPAPSPCAMQEFVGDLPQFISLIGGEEFGDMIKPVADAGAVIGGPGATAADIMQGFNEAYRPLADVIDHECPHLSGDVHVHTIDRVSYDFQAVGEYVALRSEDDDLVVQVRLVPVFDSVSVIQSVAIRVGDTVVVVVNGPDPTVEVDGAPLGRDSAITTPGGATIVRLDRGVGVILPDLFTQVVVHNLSGNALALNAILAADRSGTVSGLLGNGNGDPSDDLALPDGTVVANEFDVLHGSFRDAWRVRDQDLLLPGPSVFDPDHPAVQVSLDAEDRARARRTCIAAGVYLARPLQNCTIDVALTGDAGFADTARAMQRARLEVVGDCDLAASSSSVALGVTPGRTWASARGPTSGDLAWEFRADDRTPVVGWGSATDELAVVEDARRGIVALDPATGQTRWEHVADPAGTAPAIAEGVVVGVSGQALLGLHPDDGRLCWVVFGLAAEAFRAPAVVDGMVLLQSTVGLVTVVQARDATSGSLVWEQPIDLPAVPPPAVAAGRVHLAAEAGALRAVDLATGQFAWEVPGTSPLTAVAAVDGLLVVGTSDGRVQVRSPDGGDLVWEVAVLEGPALLAVGAEVVVVAGADKVVAMDRSTGVERWSLPSTGPLAYAGSQPVIAGSVVLVHDTGEDVLRAVDLADGDVAFEIARGGLNDAPPPFVAGSLVLDANREGTLVAHR